MPYRNGQWLQHDILGRYATCDSGSGSKYFYLVAPRKKKNLLDGVIPGDSELQDATWQRFTPMSRSSLEFIHLALFHTSVSRWTVPGDRTFMSILSIIEDLPTLRTFAARLVLALETDCGRLAQLQARGAAVDPVQQVLETPLQNSRVLAKAVNEGHRGQTVHYLIRGQVECESSVWKLEADVDSSLSTNFSLDAIDRIGLAAPPELGKDYRIAWLNDTACHDTARRSFLRAYERTICGRLADSLEAEDDPGRREEGMSSPECAAETVSGANRQALSARSRHDRRSLRHPSHVAASASPPRFPHSKPIGAHDPALVPGQVHNPDVVIDAFQNNDFSEPTTGLVPDPDDGDMPEPNGVVGDIELSETPSPCPPASCWKSLLAGLDPVPSRPPSVMASPPVPRQRSRRSYSRSTSTALTTRSSVVSSTRSLTPSILSSGRPQSSRSERAQRRSGSASARGPSVLSMPSGLDWALRRRTASPESERPDISAWIYPSDDWTQKRSAQVLPEDKGEKVERAVG